MADNDRHGDPVLARGLTQPRRRDVLGLGGLAAAGLALAACSGGGEPQAAPWCTRRTRWPGSGRPRSSTGT